MIGDTYKAQAGLPALIFLLLTLAIAGLGYFVFQQQTKNLKESAQDGLAAIADLKADQIARWRREREGDALTTGQDHFLASAVTQWFQAGSPTDERRQQILDRMSALQKSYDYEEVVLLDGQGAARLSASGASGAVSRFDLRLALEAMRSGAPMLSDLHRAEEMAGLPTRLDVFAPLLDRSGVSVGLLLLRVAPERFLFPLVQSWPSPSPTAETLLVERRDNEVVFLNELRHRKNTALALRHSMGQKDAPATKAAHGEEGLVEGVDYRGVPVLAALRKVPNSPWGLVAKVDQHEVYAPVYTRAWLMAGLAVVFIASAALSTVLWQRQQHARFLVHEYRNRLERQALMQHFDYLSKYANDVILLCDNAFRIVELNDRALETYGYAREELLGRNVDMLCAPGSADDCDRTRRRLLERKSLVFETRHQRKDRTVFPVEVSSRRIETEGETYHQGIIRDITVRKRHEEHIQLLMREVNHRSKNLLNVILAIVRMTEASSVTDFVERFEERIEALAVSQDLLVHNEWKGVGIEALVRSQLGHFDDDVASRITLAGPPLTLLASAAQTLGMAVHELATNAGKYGSLSSETGRVEITWRVQGPSGVEAARADGKRFTMEWRESGGPAISAPKRSGFGSIVVRDMVRMGLDAEPELNYASTGLVWRFTAPLDKVIGRETARPCETANAGRQYLQ